MTQNARAVTVSEADRKELESWVRSTTTEQRLVQRARIILTLAGGGGNAQVGRQLGIREATVSKWRGRFVRGGLEGLRDAPRSGRPHTYTATTRQRILDQLDRPPPKGYATWSGSLVAKALGDVSARHVWRVLAEHKIQVQRRRSWCIS